MFIKYDNKLYDFLDKQEYFKIITREESKTDETYYKKMYVFIKEISPSDPKIEDIYEVDFYVYYMDDSETLKQAKADGKWCVNEGRPACRPPQL